MGSNSQPSDYETGAYPILGMQSWQKGSSVRSQGDVRESAGCRGVASTVNNAMPARGTGRRARIRTRARNPPEL